MYISSGLERSSGWHGCCDALRRDCQWQVPGTSSCNHASHLPSGREGDGLQGRLMQVDAGWCRLMQVDAGWCRLVMVEIQFLQFWTAAPCSLSTLASEWRLWTWISWVRPTSQISDSCHHKDWLDITTPGCCYQLLDLMDDWWLPT